MNKLDLSAQEYFNFILNKRQKDWEIQNSKIITGKEYPIPYRPKTRKPIEIPKDWVWMTIDQITLKMNAGSTPRGGKKVYRNNGIMFIRSQNVQMGRLETKYIAYISKEIHQKMEGSKVYYGDVLLNITGASIGRITWFNLKNCEANVNQHVSVIRLVENIPDWIVLFFSTKWGQKQILDYQSGSTRQGLNINNQKQLMFPLAPLKEQIKIISILNNLNKIIIGTQKIIKQLQLLKKGLMQRLFTQGIGHTEFKETKLGNIPKDWDVVRLDNISNNLYYGITAKAVSKESKIKMLRVTDIKNYNIDGNNLPFCKITEKRNNIQKYYITRGDLIVARAGTTGISVLIDRDINNAIFGSYLIKIVLNEKVYPKFIHYFFQSSMYWKQIKACQAGSTLKNINLPILKSLRVTIPPSIKEQEKIASILSNIDKKIEIELDYKNKRKEIKKGLMHDLLTGKKRVNLE